MSSSNGSGRPAGSVSIPVEIIRDSNPTGPRSHSRQNSPFRPIYNDGTFGGFADSPPWGSNSTSRFQPRHSPNSAYDRLINNSQFNQPHNEHVSYPQYQEAPYRPSQTRLFEGSPSQLRRSNDDLLSAPFESMHFNAPQPQFSTFMPPFATGFPSDSDFVQPIRFPSQQRRSYEALNDFPDMHQSFPSTRQYPTDHGPSPQQQPPPPPPSQQQQPQQQQQQHPHYRSTFQTQHQPSPPQQQQQQQQPTYGNQPYNNPNIVYLNEYGVPTDHYQPNTFQGSANNMARDRSHSPAAPRGASPAQQPQPQPQPQEEPELKMAKDADGPIPMPAPASSSTASASSAQSTEPQVPPSDTGATTNTSSTPPPEPARDPNSVALEKLAQIKQTLNTLEKEVDAFTGSTRHERAYKVLDEQALKIMIRCDELVDISADIRAKRKEMIRDVQRVIGKLESKVPGTPAVEQNSNPLEAASTSDGQSGAAAHNESTPGAQSSSPTAHNDTSSAATEQSRTG